MELEPTKPRRLSHRNDRNPPADQRWPSAARAIRSAYRNVPEPQHTTFIHSQMLWMNEPTRPPRMNLLSSFGVFGSLNNTGERDSTLLDESFAPSFFESVLRQRLTSEHTSGRREIVREFFIHVPALGISWWFWWGSDLLAEEPEASGFVLRGVIFLIRFRWMLWREELCGY